MVKVTISICSVLMRMERFFQTHFAYINAIYGITHPPPHVHTLCGSVLEAGGRPTATPTERQGVGWGYVGGRIRNKTMCRWKESQDG